MVWTILAIVGLAVVGFYAGQFLFKQDTEVENRRRAAIKISSSMKEHGLEKVAAFLEDYSVGDYSGMVKKMKDLGAILADPAMADLEFDKVFTKLLDVKLNDPAKRAKLLEAINAKMGSST